MDPFQQTPIESNAGFAGQGAEPEGFQLALNRRGNHTRAAGHKAFFPGSKVTQSLIVAIPLDRLHEQGQGIDEFFLIRRQSGAFFAALGTRAGQEQERN